MGNLWGPALMLLVLASSVPPGGAESDLNTKKKRLCYHSRSSDQSMYDFEIKDVHGEEPIDWSKYRGKVSQVLTFKKLNVKCM